MRSEPGVSLGLCFVICKMGIVGTRELIHMCQMLSRAWHRASAHSW